MSTAFRDSRLEDESLMSDDSRRHEQRLPKFYLAPVVNGHRIDPQVRAVAERLWPWAWHYIGTHLADDTRAAEVVEAVACRVSRYLEAHPGKVRSVVSLFCTATTNLIRSGKTREGRIDYRGLGQDLEDCTTARAPDWQKDVELWILAEEIGQHMDPAIREMFHLRLLDWSWKEIGKIQGLTASQAWQRFHRALEKLPQQLFPRVLLGVTEKDRRAAKARGRGRS